MIRQRRMPKRKGTRRQTQTAGASFLRQTRLAISRGFSDTRRITTVQFIIEPQYPPQFGVLWESFIFAPRVKISL